MTTMPFTHFVLVDFENVTAIDLSLAEGKPVHVTLMIGEKQTKISTPLVKQIHRLAAQVDLLEVGSSGRNALDLTLAFYLGKTVERCPTAEFTIVSKDKDFDAMLSHVSRAGIKAVRREIFGAVFQSAAKKPVSKPPFAAEKAAVTSPISNRPPVADKFEKFVLHLRNSPPSTKTKLEHMIEAYFKPTMPAGGKKGLINRLLSERVIEIDSAQKVALL